MTPNVEFSEEDALQNRMPKARPVTMTDLIVRTGIVSRPRDAELLLGLLAVLLFFATYYLFTIAVPPEKTLGKDILAPGEAIPEYVKDATTQ